jgi:hypothetical protein
MILTASLAVSACSAPSPKAAPVEESPLSRFFEDAHGGALSPEEQEKKFAEDERQREELIAQCMTKEGFEYTPNIQNASSDTAAEGGEWDPDSREWVAQYGYGIINYPGRDEADSGEQVVDANADYIASLSESEQAAFDEALYGPVPDEGQAPVEDEAAEWDWTAAGCLGWAEHEREQSGELPAMPEAHEPLMIAVNEFYETMTSSPEVAEIDAEWALCMTDEGQPGFSAQSDAQTSINDESIALYEKAGETGPDEAALAALGDKEIELALVDLDCRDETDYRSKVQEVQNKQEQQFIDDHRTELEAFKADLEQAS